MHLVRVGAQVVEFILVEALDINDDGWIIARGASAPGAPDRAYLLRRVESCPADLNGDGCAGVLDFLIILEKWTDPGEVCGDCENEDLCDACLGDIDLDCTVGAGDFLALLGNWGNCPGFGGCPGSSAASSSGLPLELAALGLGFKSLDDFEAWLADADANEAYGTLELLAVLMSE